MISSFHMTTKDPSRFLKLLCHHFSLKIPAAYDAEKGYAEFPMGRCEMWIDGETLCIQATAESQERLDTVKAIVGQHVVLFGKREHLLAVWHDEPTKNNA